LEESQRNITTCLLDTLCHVPPFRKNGVPPAAQIHRLSNAVSAVVVLPFYISPVADVFGRKQEQPAKHQLSRQGSSAVLMSSPYKNKSSRRLKRKERSEEIFVRNTPAEEETNVSVNRGEHENEETREHLTHRLQTPKNVRKPVS